MEPVKIKKAASRWSYISVLLLLLGLACCQAASPQTDMGINLLSLRVNSSQPRDYASFNEAVAKAMVAGESWAGDPIMVVRKFAKWGNVREAVWVIQGRGEFPSQYEILAIADGFHDDSIRGERFAISLKINPDRSWFITAAQVTWRCWPGRGHEYYGTDVCS